MAESSIASQQARSQARAAALRRQAQEEESAAEQRDEEANQCAKRRLALEEKLAACKARGHSADEALAAINERVAQILQQASRDVRSLTKQQLEEVRSLPRPVPVVKRALGLVYCVLHPEGAASFLAADGTYDVPWKERLVPMLSKEDLLRRLTEMLPSDGVHPLVAFPELAQRIEQQVALQPAGGTESHGQGGSSGASADGQATGSGSRGRKSKETSGVHEAGHSERRRNSAAIRSAAHLLRRGTNASSSASLLGEGDRLTIEAVSYASKAVGALFRWVLSQIRCAQTLREAGIADADAKAASAQAQCEASSAEEASLEAAMEEVRRAEAAAQAAADASRMEAEDLRRKARAADAEAEELQARTAPSLPEPEPILASALEAGAVAVTDVEVEVRQRVTFGTGSAAMSSFATRAVHGVVSVMRRHEGVKLCVEGHTRPGEADSLSTERANRVLELLVKQGVPRHRLRAAGFGSTFSGKGQGGESQGRVVFSVIQEISVKGTVQFSPCSEQLTRASEPLLEGIAALLTARPCLRVRVEGHTDNAPYFGSNMELAEGRARNVIGFLAGRGIDAERLTPLGFGETLPRVSNDSREGRAQNRRVEFHVLQRETVRGLQGLLSESGERGQIDLASLRQLARTATGATIGLALPIRTAAADLLVRVRGDWPVQRLLLLAGRRGDPKTCPLARLSDDCIHHVLRLFFLLGCSSLSDGAAVGSGASGKVRR